MTLIFFSHRFLSSGRYPTYEKSLTTFQPPSRSRGQKRETIVYDAQWEKPRDKALPYGTQLPCALSPSRKPGNPERTIYNF